MNYHGWSDNKGSDEKTIKLTTEFFNHTNQFCIEASNYTYQKKVKNTAYNDLKSTWKS